MFMKVDFPEPEAPMIAIYSPFSTVRETPLSARTLTSSLRKKVFSRSTIRISFSSILRACLFGGLDESDEDLVSFFKAAFYFRVIITPQSGLHPDLFDRQASGKPVFLPPDRIFFLFLR